MAHHYDRDYGNRHREIRYGLFPLGLERYEDYLDQCREEFYIDFDYDGEPLDFDPWQLAKRELNEQSPHAKEYRAIYTHNRRADGELTLDVLVAARDAQGDKCIWCGCDLNGGGHVEHLHPVALGGTNDGDNIAWSCQPCNSKKGSMPLDVWLTYLSERSHT